MITVPSQHTESHVRASTARPSITVAQLIRWSGLATILAGILYALETLLHPARDITNLAAITQQSVLGVSWYVSHTLGIAAGLLALLGLIGLYVRQFDRLGGLGLAGFVTTLIGTAMLAGTLVPDAYVFPVVGGRPATASLLHVPGPFGAYWAFVAASGLTFVLGTAPFSIASVRARVLSPWGFVLISVGTPLVGFGPLLANVLGLIGAVLMGLGYIWLGCALWKHPAATEVHPSAQ
jgi:hypothetical protein